MEQLIAVKKISMRIVMKQVIRRHLELQAG